MRVTHVALTVTLFVLGYLLSFLPIAAAAEGVIEGQLRNGTAGGAVPAGLTVVLNVLAEDDRLERVQAVTDANGSYRFGGLETRPGLRYLPLVEYSGASYFSRPLSLADQPRQSADIMVYEATSSDEWIVYERANLLVQNVAPNRLHVLEMGSLANVGDRTYLGPEHPSGEPRPTLRFSLPTGALDVAPQVGFAPNDFSVGQNGFTIASPVLPGRHQLAFSYSLPLTSDRLQIEKHLDYPVASFNLYLPDLGLRVDSRQLEQQGQAELGGQSYLLYTARSLPRGADLGIALGGLPFPVSSPAQRLTLPILAAGGAVLLLGLLAGLRSHQTGLNELNPLVVTNGRAHTGGADLESAELLLRLASLDERHERGELDEGEYRLEREAAKRRLVSLRQRRIGTQAGGR